MQREIQIISELKPLINPGGELLFRCCMRDPESRLLI